MISSNKILLDKKIIDRRIIEREDVLHFSKQIRLSTLWKRKFKMMICRK